MKIVAKKTFDGPLQIIIRDEPEVVKVVMATNTVSHAVPLSEYKRLFDEDNYRPIRVDDKYDCCVCGEGDAQHRYKSSSITIHSPCREQLGDHIRSVLENNSVDLVGATI